MLRVAKDVMPFGGVDYGSGGGEGVIDPHAPRTRAVKGRVHRASEGHLPRQRPDPIEI